MSFGGDVVEHRGQTRDRHRLAGGEQQTFEDRFEAFFFHSYSGCRRAA